MQKVNRPAGRVPGAADDHHGQADQERTVEERKDKKVRLTDKEEEKEETHLEGQQCGVHTRLFVCPHSSAVAAQQAGSSSFHTMRQCCTQRMSSCGTMLGVL